MFLHGYGGEFEGYFRGAKSAATSSIKEMRGGKFFFPCGEILLLPIANETPAQECQERKLKNQKIHECGCTESRGLGTQNPSREEDQKKTSFEITPRHQRNSRDGIFLFSAKCQGEFPVFPHTKKVWCHANLEGIHVDRNVYSPAAPGT